MDVNGCQIESKPANTPEGWTTTVTKHGVLKGPFGTIAEAVACAQTWTASEAVAVQITGSSESSGATTFNPENRANDSNATGNTLPLEPNSA